MKSGLIALAIFYIFCSLTTWLSGATTGVPADEMFLYVIGHSWFPFVVMLGIGFLAWMLAGALE